MAAAATWLATRYYYSSLKEEAPPNTSCKLQKEPTTEKDISIDVEMFHKRQNRGHP